MSTKEIILSVTSDLFMKKGYQTTSTREIALNAGITQPNLYNHFTTKEAIYIAVLEKLSNEVEKALEKLVETSFDSLYENLIMILNYLRESHPANFSIMRHDLTYEISKENHNHLYQIWQESYLAPLSKSFSKYLSSDSPFSSEELSRYFYSMIAPFIQKDNQFYKEVTSDKVIYLFIHGIIGGNEKGED